MKERKRVGTILARRGRELGALFALLALGAALSVLSPHFLSVSNLLNVLEQTAIGAVIAVGMTFVILSGGIDLSVGSVLALAGIVLAGRLEAGWGVGPALLAGLLVGAACGFVNGLLVTRGRLPPFIATLGMMSVARGAALLLTEGRPISGFEAGFRSLATGRLLYLPASVLVAALVFALAHVVLRRTVFGRRVYAIGGNEEASLFSGVPVGATKALVYAVCGLASGLGAALLTARLNSAQPIAGLMYELDAIAATVIGGTSLRGGSGGVMGTLLGALIMGVLRNGLNLLGISSFLQQVVIGLVIVGAVLLDAALRPADGR
jgi:ribose/xylose/arabinose/galactoside ABC-type transport system permease subunit